MKAILVEDVASHRDDILFKIAKNCPEISMVDHSDSVAEGLKLIRVHKPNLVFLDVELGDETGFDLLNQLEKIDFKVIFVSGYEKYAHRAFKHLAIDYLLKPVDEAELVSAIGRAKEELSRGICQLNFEKLKTIENLGKPFEFFCINDRKGFSIVYFTRLIQCQADGYCTRFHVFAEDGGVVTISSSQNLSHYKEQLIEHDFIQVNRACIINTKHITGYNHQDQMISLSRGCSAPLRDSYKKAFFNFIKTNGRKI